MRPQDAVRGATVLGNGGLTIRRSRHHRDVTGSAKRPCGKEFHHGGAAGEPHAQRWHFESHVGLQQRGECGHVGVFECRAVTVEQLAARRAVRFDGVVFGGRDLGQPGPRPL